MSSSLKTDATLENKASTKNGVKRLIFVVLAMVLEFLVNFFLIMYLGAYEEWIMILLHIMAAALVLYIYNQEKTAAVCRYSDLRCML